jgi:hypothetical protein
LTIERTETNFQRQAALHDYPPRLLGDGNTQIEIATASGKNMLFSKQSRENKNLLYRHYKPKETTMEETHSFVLHKSPFASVSKTVSRGHPSLVSLGA